MRIGGRLSWRKGLKGAGGMRGFVSESGPWGGKSLKCRIILMVTSPILLLDIVKPEAWLSSGPSPGPGRLLLVCRVSGFYPKPVQVMWMRGDQEQPHTRQGDFLPNADGTWYLRVTLDVAAGDAAGLSCRVKHSSLGGQDIILYWAGSHTSVHLIVVLVVLALLGLSAGLIFWFRRRRSYQGIL